MARLTWTSDQYQTLTLDQDHELQVTYDVWGNGRRTYQVQHCGHRLMGTYRTARGAKRAAGNIHRETVELEQHQKDTAMKQTQTARIIDAARIEVAARAKTAIAKEDRAAAAPMRAPKTVIIEVEQKYKGEAAMSTKREHVLHFLNNRYGVCYVPAGREARRVDQGPMVPGPWAAAFGLCTVIAANPEHGTGAIRRNNVAAGTEHDVVVGDLVQIGPRPGGGWDLFRVEAGQGLRADYLRLELVVTNVINQPVTNNLVQKESVMKSKSVKSVKSTPSTNNAAKKESVMKSKKTAPVTDMPKSIVTPKAIAKWKQDRALEAATASKPDTFKEVSAAVQAAKAAGVNGGAAITDVKASGKAAKGKAAPKLVTAPKPGVAAKKADKTPCTKCGRVNPHGKDCRSAEACKARRQEAKAEAKPVAASAPLLRRVAVRKSR